MYAFNSSTPEPAGFDRPALWFVYQGHRLLVRAGVNGAQPGYEIPRLPHVQALLPAVDRVHYLGLLGEVPCYVGELPEGMVLPADFERFNLRRLFGQLEDDLLRVAGRAVHILDWDRNHQFCGRCGSPTTMTDDRARICPTCSLRSYPRISPAVIMAVTRGEEILLAHANRHPQGFYSVLAGFSEPGETLEETVVREVQEEVGIEVRNIRDFGSQPWPFPDSLMIGFTCEHASGEISLVDSELDDAGWYRAGRFPGLTPPPEISIAGRLIRWFVEQHQP